MHRAAVVGNLPADPEMRYLPDGKPVTSFDMASTRKFKDFAGEQKEETEWFSVSVFGRLAGPAAEYLRKGSQVFVAGRFSSRAYITETGEHRVSLDLVATEVQFLDSQNLKQAAAAARASFIAGVNDYAPV